MESGEEETGLIIPLQEYPSSDFGIVDFMDNESNFDQLIDHIWGENTADTIVNFSSQAFNLDQHSIDGGCLANNHLSSSVQDQLLDYNNDCSTLNEFPNGVDEEESSETTTTTTNTASKKKQKKSDRRRSLISERRRRGRMKEKLYALRSLVPNITKMDKASIIGDAVLYVQDLQMQAKKLKSEIASLDSSLTKGDKNNIKKIINAAGFCPNPTIKKIFKIDVFEVEEDGFYVRIVSNKEKGVAVCLLKAIHALARFNVRTSNLATDAQTYVLTFTLHMEKEVDMNLSSLKMWVAKAFLGQGFEFETSKFV